LHLPLISINFPPEFGCIYLKYLPFTIVDDIQTHIKQSNHLTTRHLLPFANRAEKCQIIIHSFPIPYGGRHSTAHEQPQIYDDRR
jgi:hypothetical protein